MMTPMTMPDGLVTLRQIEARRNVPHRTLQRWVAAGKLVPVHRIPGGRGTLLFRIEDAETVVAQERAGRSRAGRVDAERAEGIDPEAA